MNNPSLSGASYGERLMYKVRQSLQQQLIPGEHLEVAVHGQVGPSVVSILFTGGSAASELRQFHIGVTEHDLVCVEFDQWGKPMELRRSPLSQVKLVESKEGPLTDKIVIDMGETRPLRVRISRLMRQGTQQLVRILSSDEIQVGEIMSTSLTENAKEPPVQTPFGKLLLWGTGAAMVGNLTGWLLNAFVLSLLMSSNFMEGYGYLAALLCWIVGLPGSLVFGVLAAWLGPVVSRSRLTRVKNATALLGFSLSVATWVAISVLAIIVDRITA